MSKNSHKTTPPKEQRSIIRAGAHMLTVDHPVDIASRRGPLWLFIHGIAASAGFWAPLMPAAFRRRAVWVSASLPIHGTSSAPAGFSRADVTPDLFIDVYKDVIEQFGEGRQIIPVGHSTGGFAGLCLAHALPDRIIGVVSAGGFADGKWTGLEGEMQKWARKEKLGPFGPALLKLIAFATKNSSFIQRRAAAEFAFDKKTFLRDEPTAQSLEALRTDSTEQNANHLIEFFAGIRDVDIWDWISDIRQPVLVINGERDPVIPMQQTRDLVARLPNAELKLFTGAGHMIMNERRDAFWSEILSWRNSAILSEERTT
jgi:pimeloyl-ACP methyl ester carboxylesterase